MSTLGTLLLWCVFQVTLLAIVTIIAYFLARRGGASLRSSLILTGLITATLLIPLIWSPWPHWELPRAVENKQEPISAVTEINNDVDSSALTPSNIKTTNNGSPSLELEPITWRTTWNNFVEALENPQPADSAVSPASPDPGNSWPKVVLGLFGAALFVGLARLVGGYWSVRRTIRQARPLRDPRLLERLDMLRAELSCKTPVELRETHKTATAAATGWRRPVILLPIAWRGWTAEQTRAVLAHELAHIVRGDYLTTCITHIALAPHFYHPLWQWLVGRLRLEQELAADALAANITGGRDAYLKILAELALRRSDAAIAWPARAFLPSRHTFLRRVEMLRDPKFAGDRSGLLSRTASVVGLLMLGLVIAGIRPGTVVAEESGSDATTVNSQPDRETTPEANKGGGAMIPAVAYFPDDGQSVMVFHPRRILNDPRFEEHEDPIKALFQELREPAFVTLRNAGGVLDNMETVAIGYFPWTDTTGGGTHFGTVFQLAESIDRSVIKEAAARTTSVAGRTVYHFNEYSAATIVNAKTLLLASDNEIVALMAMIEAAEDGGANSLWIDALEKLDSPAVAILGNSEAISSSLDKLREKNNRVSQQLNNVLAPVQPLITGTIFAGIGLQLGEKTRLLGYAESDDPAAAERVAETLTALVTMAQNVVRQFKQRIAEQPGENKAVVETNRVMVETFIPLVEQLFQTAKINTQDNHVTLTMSAGETSATLTALLPAIEQFREAVRRSQAKYNPKQIGLAFHNYHAAHGYLPPAVIKENGVAHSWRVEILPFLGYEELYKQYRTDEPWDSEHNETILAQMPDVFRGPSDNSEPYSTSYYLLTNEHAVTNSRTAHDTMKLLPGNKRVPNQLPVAEFVLSFTDKPIDIQADERGPWMGDITDGTSPTIMVVESSRNVPWTKPEDIPVDSDKIAELLKEDLGGNHEGHFLAAMFDGSVRYFSKDIDPELLKKLITPSGGEVIDLDAIMPAPRPEPPPRQPLLPPQQPK